MAESHSEAGKAKFYLSRWNEDKSPSFVPKKGGNSDPETEVDKLLSTARKKNEEFWRKRDKSLAIKKIVEELKKTAAS